MLAALHPAAEAFGKVILLGEHSVVYGHPALAAGLPQGLRLTAEESPDPAAANLLEIPAWGIELALDDPQHPVALSARAVVEACGGPLCGWLIRGETTLPARAGLGSSAALTVAIARLALGPGAALDAVVEASMVGERIFHGQPSGLDSAIAARGGLLRFVRGAPVEAIALTAPLPLIILPSGIARSTAVEVARVASRRDRLPGIIGPVLGSLGVAVEAGIDAITSNDLNRLGEIMNVSHELLSALGVSTPALDIIVSRARTHGAPGAKLTGAGGGGCAIALPPERPAALLAASEAAGIHPLLVEVQP